MQSINTRRAREPRKAVRRDALLICGEGKVVAPCTITSISRSGLGLMAVPPKLPDQFVVLDVAAGVIFEGSVVRRNGVNCGLRIKSTFSIGQLPERLAFVATIRRPESH